MRLTVRSHPSPALRHDYALGNLAPGAALAMRVHLEFCPVCRLTVESMSAPVSGARAPAETEETARGEAGTAGTPCAELAKGPWWLLSPLLRIRRFSGVAGLGEAVSLVEARRGASLSPLYAPGVEMLMLLWGCARDGSVQYEAGDFLQLGARSTLRAPSADPETGCCCLVVGDEAWPRSRLSRFMLSRSATARPRFAHGR